MRNWPKTPFIRVHDIRRQTLANNALRLNHQDFIKSQRLKRGGTQGSDRRVAQTQPGMAGDRGLISRRAIEHHSSADNTAAVSFPRLLVEHLRLSAQVIRPIHQFVQSNTSLQHAIDGSVLEAVVTVSE